MTPDRYAAWRDLALSFPVIRECVPDATTLTPDALDAWAVTYASRGADAAARFLLATWSPRHSWRAGPFDLFVALRYWDGGQLAAFHAWVAAGCRTF